MNNFLLDDIDKPPLENSKEGNWSLILAITVIVIMLSLAWGLIGTLLDILNVSNTVYSYSWFVLKGINMVLWVVGVVFGVLGIRKPNTLKTFAITGLVLLGATGALFLLSALM